MAQIINTNIASLNAQRNLNTSQSANSQALERLSSGLRINSAKDDAAGLAISTKFESQTRGLNQAIRNAGDGISLAQTAEGALGTMTDNLQRIRELAVQSANATNSDEDRAALQQEVSALVAEVTRTADETNFNGRNLFDGQFNGTFQIGANAGQTVDVQIGELTAERLGSSSQVGVSAIGTDSAIENGDLIINGVAIGASKAGDDTASTSMAATSAIAKATAINQASDQTGVTANVNENVAAGSAMVGGTTSGSITLNGVDIELSTSGDEASTRASVAQAINAVSDQTGIKAVDSGSSANGVQLVAEDGRNVEISFSTAGGDNLTAASTGLAEAGTYQGGYTLIASGQVKEITIEGGNGTGRGDLANAGLSAGTYSRATAVNVSDKVAVSTETEASVINGGILNNEIDRADDTATLISENGGTKTNLASTALGAIDITTANTFTSSVKVGTAEFTVANAAGDTVAEYGAKLDAAAVTATVGGDVNFYEQVDFNITGLTTAAGGGTFTLAGQAFSLADTTVAGYDAAENLAVLADNINAAQAAGSFAGAVGATGTVVAELNEARDAISIRVKNESGTNITATTNAGTTSVATTLNGAGGAQPISGTTAFNIGGNLAYEATGTEAVKVTSVATTGELRAVADTSSTEAVNGSALSTSSEVDIAVSIDGKSVAVAGSPLAAGSTVADLADAVNNVTGVSAWEEISSTLTLSTTNGLEAGDTINLAGVDILISADENGNVTEASIRDNINATDFSGANIDVAATLNGDGDEVTLTIRNFSGDALNISADDSEQRGFQLDGNFVGGLDRQLSGELKFVSESGAPVSVTLSDPEGGGEVFAGTSSSVVDYSGVNGLEDGDVSINGVTIGAARVSDDTASATVGSDGGRILSSSKELSAIAVAGSINAVADETGVSATVNATEVVGGDGTGLGDTTLASGPWSVGDEASIFINGVNVGVVTLQADGSNTNIDTDRARADALNLINQNSGKTGVVAEDNGVSLSLSAADGRNVSIAIDDRSGNDASIGALFGMDAGVAGIGEATFGLGSAAGAVSAEGAAYETTYGSVKLESAGQFTIEGGSKGAEELASLGLKVGTYGGGEDGQFLKDVDISTFEGAQAAITAIDNALGTVASQRAELGALQNRFESTVSNLAITAENLTAANSRIRDADFAAETAELSRTQVLQQAGISILAQANQRPQQVLSLLG